jgi:hypothetical protein
MAQQLINVGSAANDRTGDTWRDAFIKVNANETELFTAVNAQSLVYISQESDFPNQDATTITLETLTIYVVSQAFTTGKRFIAQEGAVMTSFNIFGPIVTYTGAGAMFTATDVNFKLVELNVVCPSAQVFDVTDSVGGVYSLVVSGFRALNCLKLGTINNLLAFELFNSFAITSQGLEVIGNSYNVFSINKVAYVTTSAAFIGVDLGTSVINNIEIQDLICDGVSGSIGISGLANSGNVPTGRIAELSNSSFSSGMTPLQNITVDDIRWRFTGNTPISDTFEDALIAFNGNTTETVISTINTPVIVNATWVEESASFFTSTSGGRLTYNGERDARFPIDISAGLISSGGGAIDVSLYLAKNGSVITNSKTPISISGSDPQTLSIPWQDDMSENDFYEVFVENNSNTTNIIVEYCKLRIN